MMKSIKLTKEHKSKLLEMCKVLFPEYKSIVFSKDHEQFEEGEDNNILLFFSGKAEIAPSIHWFEFCMTYLVNKVFHDSMKHDYIKEEHDSLITGLLRNDLHPIDYIYDKFKKLK